MTDLKPGWTRVAFGEVVRLCRERSSKPEADGFERYVGLEHLEPGDLKLRHWGNVADGTTFTNVFRAGQVLFGKRRAYQRKVAVADFDGVCSGDIYVLESKNEHLLPELLPFICQTDGFFEHAIGTSAGSLSPRTNWKSLASFEFALPPPEEQRRVAQVLRASEETVTAFRSASQSAEKAFSSALIRLMAHGIGGGHPAQTENLTHPSDWPIVTLAEIATVERGKFSHRPRNLPKFFGGPYPFVQTGDIAAARGRGLQASQRLSEEGVQYSRSFPSGTILITIAAVIGATAITTDETWCTDSVVGIVPHDQDTVDFIEYAMRYIRSYLEFEVATQTAQKNINLDILRPLRIPWPDLETRSEVVRILSEVERATVMISGRANDLRRLTQALLRQLVEKEP